MDERSRSLQTSARNEHEKRSNSSSRRGAGTEKDDLLASTSASRSPHLTSTSAGSTSRSLASTAASSTLLTTSTTSLSTPLRPRHSLYGTEDRVVLDLGSRIWKAGFSGESTPRVCQDLTGSKNNLVEGCNEFQPLWGLKSGEIGEMEWQVREERLKRGLRNLWFNCLMTDPKSRKTIVVESPLLPVRFKEMIARVLLGNLQVPSMSFASAPVLSLMAAGKATGLVIDCGHLETTVVPVFHSRPMYSLLRSSPRASAALDQRLRSLLDAFGSYKPPPSSLNSMTDTITTKIPDKLISSEFLQEIKCRACFVGEAIRFSDQANFSTAARFGVGIISDQDELLELEKKYASSSQATSIMLAVPSEQIEQPAGVGNGWIEVPGWVKERAAEVIFEEGDEDALGVTRLILSCLLSIPIDLRKPLASSILVTGGAVMMPGFIARLRGDLVQELSDASRVETSAPAAAPSTTGSQTKALQDSIRIKRLLAHRSKPRFAPIMSLAPHIAVLNDTSITIDGLHNQIPLSACSGRSPAFSASLIPWIGGSLAGSLKTGGDEISRQRWEEWSRSKEKAGSASGALGFAESGDKENSFLLPDWSCVKF